MKVTIRGGPRPDQPRQPAVAVRQELSQSLGICRHRGDAIAHLDIAASCGCDRRIFACAVHGRCVSAWHQAHNAKVIAAAAAQGIPNCAVCPEFRADGEQ